MSSNEKRICLQDPHLFINIIYVMILKIITDKISNYKFSFWNTNIILSVLMNLKFSFALSIIIHAITHSLSLNFQTENVCLLNYFNYFKITLPDESTNKSTSNTIDSLLTEYHHLFRWTWLLIKSHYSLDSRSTRKLCLTFSNHLYWHWRRWRSRVKIRNCLWDGSYGGIRKKPSWYVHNGTIWTQ